MVGSAEFSHGLGQSRHFGRRPTASGLPLETDIVRAGRHVSKGSMLSKKSQIALRPISRRMTNHATIVRRYAPRPVTEVTGEFIAYDAFPPQHL